MLLVTTLTFQYYHWANIYHWKTKPINHHTITLFSYYKVIVLNDFNIDVAKNNADIQYEIIDVLIIEVSSSMTTPEQIKSNSNTIDIKITGVNTYMPLPVK